jgi:hypothetical protein
VRVLLSGPRAQIARSGVAMLLQSRTERRLSRQSKRAQNRRSVLRDDLNGASHSIRVHIHSGQSRMDTRWRRRQLSALPTISAATAQIGYSVETVTSLPRDDEVLASRDVAHRHGPGRKTGDDSAFPAWPAVHPDGPFFGSATPGPEPTLEPAASSHERRHHHAPEHQARSSLDNKEEFDTRSRNGLFVARSVRAFGGSLLGQRRLGWG